MIKRLFLLILLCLPILTWALVKPVRMLAPGVLGVICEGVVCVEDEARLAEAKALYVEALGFVEEYLQPVKDEPRLIYCSTAECYRSFGGGKERAISYPMLGSLISPDALSAHFVRHELIHHLQFQELGAVQTMLAPEWFREGMAYAVSAPPAEDLPEQFQPYVQRYEEWLESVPQGQLWPAARRL